MNFLNGWDCTKLTSGSEEGVFHAHAYYDIPVFDPDSRLVAGHAVRFAERQPTPADPIEIGYADVEGDRTWTPVGESRAWSWQQGAMAQWLLRGRTLVWNDREGDDFVARTFDVDSGATATLPRPVYALDPNGRFALALNMARLDHVRPGYGYVGGGGARMDERKPSEDGVWKVDLETGESELILSLREAAQFLTSRLSLKSRLKHAFKRYTYWFNHAKISPDGERFTVKLRFRRLGKGWNDQQGVSLTCGTDGRDLRLLTDGTSHVIWLDDEHLYLWQRDGVYLYADERPEGRRTGRIAPDLIDHNVHIRHFPGTTDRFVFDTPYREEIDLFAYDAHSESQERIASFSNHTPKRGLFRCDLHPCPSPDAQKIVVTPMDDGGRHISPLSRRSHR
jgi:hypothetical protein